MYSLPITIYSDYWRRTKFWSRYVGSLAVLVAGTKYSAIENLDIGQTIQPPLQLVQSLSIDRSTDTLKEKALIGERSSQGLAGLGLNEQMQRSRGVDSLTDNDQQAPSSDLETKVGGQPVEQPKESRPELNSPQKEAITQNKQPIPKQKVIVQSPKPRPMEVDIDLTKLNIKKTLNVEATAYTYTGNNTATGVEPREGMIAVDPNVIAMGSKVYVEGYGYAIAADTGGAILGHKIDVFFSTLRQCIDWGRKPVRIYVLDSR